jgi:hypothetical protein
MSSEADGTPGNRPASRPEIAKLPRVRCCQCGLKGAAPIVDPVAQRCVNRFACRRRCEREAHKHGGRR